MNSPATVPISVFDLDVIQEVFWHLATGGSYQIQASTAQTVIEHLNEARMKAVKTASETCTEGVRK
jgi:hypothetical protein